LCYEVLRDGVTRRRVGSVSATAIDLADSTFDLDLDGVGAGDEGTVFQVGDRETVVIVEHVVVVDGSDATLIQAEYTG